MTRTDSFAGSLVFAALASVTLPVVSLGLGPLLGYTSAASLYVVGVLLFYVAGLRPRGPRWGRALCLTAVLAALLLAVAGTLAQVALGAALLLAICRSGFVYRRRPVRAFAVEAGLGGAGLLLADFVLGSGVISLALALWSYLLVQSAYFLIGGLSVRKTPAGGDDFEHARARLLRLLEEDPL